MGMIFVIVFFAIIIYISCLENKKQDIERERLYLEKNYLFLKYKNEYSKLSENSLKKICKELEKKYTQMSNNYYTYISKNGIKNYFDEYTVEPGSNVPFQYVELMIRDNHPELFYEYNCAKWILFGYELSDDRIGFESWLYDKRYWENDLFGHYYS